MAKFKKLAMLCTALMMTASVAAIAACGDEPTSSSPDSNVSSVDGSSSSPSDSSTPDESSTPDDSSSPSDSSTPDDSSSPSDSSTPDDSSTPGESSKPDDSSTPDDPDEPVEIEEITIAEAIALGEELKGDSATRYYVVGTIVSAKASNLIIADENGNEIDVYGVYDADGFVRYEDMGESAPVVGDKIKLLAYVSYFENSYLRSANILEIIPVEEIVAEDYWKLIGSDTISVNAPAYEHTLGTLSVEVPEAGKYAIFSFSKCGIQFGPEGATGDSECAESYSFEAAEAGTINLSTYVFDWNDINEEVTYYLVKTDELVLDKEAGVANIAANARTNIKFVAPAAGEYLIVTNQALTWYGEGLDEYGETTTSLKVTATEAGQEITFEAACSYNDLYVTLEWEVVEIAPVALVEGDNNMTLYAGAYMTASFTSDKTGSFTFSFECDYRAFWTENYEQSYIGSIAAGETITLELRYNGYTADYEQGPGSIDVVINVAPLEEDDPSDLQVGENIFTASEEGVAASFTAPVAGTYAFSDDYTNTMWFEDTVDYGDSYKEITLAEGEIVNFTVKYAGLVTLLVEKIIPPVTLSLGENVVNIEAGATLEWGYDVPYNTNLTYSCDNNNVVLYVDGEALANGDIFQVSWMSNFEIATADGNNVTGAKITITEYVAPALNDGDNSVEAGQYSYTVTNPGCYVFTATGDGITNFAVGSKDAYDYPDALSAAGSIAINVKPGATIDINIEGEGTMAINVACTSTVAMLEGAVTMNDDMTAPESLTIASLKAGEVAYYAASRMTGDYIVSWSSDYSIVVYAGENVGMSYEPQVLLTRTMMDGIVYFVVRNSGSEDLENVVLNFAEYVYVDPNTQPQGTLVTLNEETTIEIESWGNAIISFVAPAAGTYTLTTESSVLVDKWAYTENWGGVWDRAWENYIDSATGGSYSFTLAEGEIINFFVMEFDMGEVSFVFTISNEGGSEAPQEPTSVGITLQAGVNNNVILEANTYGTAEVYAMGKYTITFPETVTVTFNGTAVASGSVIEFANPRLGNPVVVTPVDMTVACEAVISLIAYVAPPVELDLGANAIDVEDTQNGAKATFTATKDGKYILKAADGETNAFVVMENEGVSETLDLPYAFSLNAGESITFIVLTSNWTPDTIDLVVEKDYDTLTIAEALEMVKSYQHNTYTTDMYYISGTIYDLASSTYGNCYIVDENGDTIYVYGLMNQNGTKYKDMTNKPVVGDTVKLLSTIGVFSGIPQVSISASKAATVVEHQAGVANNAAKVMAEKNGVVLDNEKVSEEKNIELDTTPSKYNDVTISWTVTSGNDCASISGNVLTIVPNATTTVTVTATIACGSYSETKDFDIDVSNVKTMDIKVATFEFGANGSASHSDGTEITSNKTYTEGSYSLTLTGLKSGTKVYGGARDAKGNSCLKLGTSSVVGAFSFTVPNEVTSVIINVAGYKSNKGSISINGEDAQTISTYSNDGKYTAVEVDTSKNKTVSFTTTSNGCRVMINSIEYITTIEADSPDWSATEENVANYLDGGYYIDTTIAGVAEGEYTVSWAMNEEGVSFDVYINGAKAANDTKMTLSGNVNVVVIPVDNSGFGIKFALKEVVAGEDEDGKWTKNY